MLQNCFLSTQKYQQSAVVLAGRDGETNAGFYIQLARRLAGNALQSALTKSVTVDSTLLLAC